MTNDRTQAGEITFESLELFENSMTANSFFQMKQIKEEIINNETNILKHEPEEINEVDAGISDNNYFMSKIKEEYEENYAIERHMKEDCALLEQTVIKTGMCKTEDVRIDDHIEFASVNIDTEMKQEATEYKSSICDMCDEMKADCCCKKPINESGCQVSLEIKKEPENEGEHINANHASPVFDGGVFRCKTCLRSFKHKKNLKEHEIVHTRDISYQCVFCLKHFKKRSQLNVHERSHTKEKPFQCKICEKPFSHNSNLKTHERIHTGEKPFPCKICPRSFRQLKQLRVHESVHTEDKPFFCKICPKRFKREDSLKLHQNIHTGNVLYKCNVCPKSFTQRYQLKVHERTHTGEKPFRCKLCLRCFNYKCSLKAHQKVHSRVKNSPVQGRESPLHCELDSYLFRRNIQEMNILIDRFRS